ncbi:HYR domain-containing protein [Catellatospora bangladeshensis]|uniref:HYR domain-containing protein n=1 Tax=Catellatospora bangladeshensis TaxID=310355 RepID=A0A8J3JDY1_9ACTN|nr:HYR domain-containing protein [Catellatospora bangladeshensis]GIF82626.1 hypothetical protein Cba03nite_39750 [Catellatospora bangladeshensis]
MRINRQRWVRWASAGVAVLVFGSASAAWADNVVADGDGATPVTGSGLSFGTVCVGSTVTKPALIGIQRNGASTGPNVFANGATVTLAVTAVTGSGVSTTPGSGTIGTIALPSNWSAQPNNTVTGALSLPVQLAATTPGAVTGSVSLSAAAGSVNRATTLAVSATVVACDTTAPVLHLPGPLTVEATGPGGALVAYTATADDENPAHPTVTCDHPSGATLPLGATTVSCSATDAAGNTGTGQFTVTVVDTAGPVIEPVMDITAVEATGPGGAVVTYQAPGAADAVAGTVPVSCSPASGAEFPLGTTTVTCTASDGHGNTSQRTFEVTVQDTQAPVLAVPADLTAEATSSQGADVTYPAASAQDAVDGAITPTCAPAAGSTFPLGTTEVTCTATDSAHNTATGTFTVTVADTTPPAITGTPADITTEATGPAGADVSFTPPTATDLVDGTVAVDCAPASGGSFPVGATTVTCSARDAAGNTATSAFQVTVRDTTPPSLTLPADQVLTATGPDGAVATFHPEATDLVDGSVPVTCSPASGATFAIGTTEVNCSATDHAGNTAQGSFKVTVRRTISGFYQPVDMNRVINTVKGGSTVPLKFEVFAGPAEATTTSIIAAISVKQYNCDPNAPLDPIEVTATGNTSLRYDSTGGQYVYNWQTPKTKGLCYQVGVSTVDGATVIALFRTT